MGGHAAFFINVAGGMDVIGSRICLEPRRQHKSRRIPWRASHMLQRGFINAREKRLDVLTFHTSGTAQVIFQLDDGGQSVCPYPGGEVSSDLLRGKWDAQPFSGAKNLSQCY